MAFPALTDTTAYPAFATKKALLQELQRMFEPTGTSWLDFAAQLNNTDLTSLTDGATVYDPAGTWAASV